MRFDNKVAIVTGAAQGIGQADAQALVREGASVVVADINADAAEGVAKQIVADGGTAVTPGEMVKQILLSRMELPRISSACAYSCCPTRLPGSPARSSMSTAARSSDHDG